MNLARAAAIVAMVVLAAGVGVLSARSAVHPKVTRAQAVTQLRRLLGARPRRVHLVFADERTTDVVLEWTAYAPSARLRLNGEPIGYTGPHVFVGPAVAWMGAAGKGPMGVSSLPHRRRGHHVLPLRSTTIPVALVRALWQDHARVRLTPLRVRPRISRVEAIRKLRGWGDRHGRLHAIWLVHFRRGGEGHVRLAWMAVTLHLRIPVLGGRCKPGQKCKLWATEPVASFLGARSGKFIYARTINGWKPQLPPG
jgi:hypothetical protein